MKAYELLNSPDLWCQESPAETAQGNKAPALDPGAVKWCALGAIQKVYPPGQWEEAMDSVLRTLSVSEKGIARMTNSDKVCCLMEWNDDRGTLFREIQEVLKEADV
jgi:hypothetical protein